MSFKDSTVLKRESLLVLNEGLSLSEKKCWRPYTQSLVESFSKDGRSITDQVVSTNAILLENTLDYFKRMDETTRTVNLGNFVDYGFQLVTATIPNLVAHELFSIQPLNAKFGAIFYLQYLYGSNKGAIGEGDIMRSPWTGSPGNFQYSSEVVDGERVGTGNGSATNFATTLLYTPIRGGSVVVTVADTVVLTGSDDGAGAITGTGFAASTIDYNTGAIDINLSAAPAADVAITVAYNYNMDLNTTNVPQVDLDLKSVPLQAFPRKLRARWLLDAAYEFQKTKGVDAESELLVALASEVKHEIDGELMADVLQAAAHTGFTFNRFYNPLTSSLSQRQHYESFVNVIGEMSDAIYKSTKRAGANFIIGGIEVCRVLETLGAPRFEAAQIQGQVNGPYVAGVLDKRYKVIKNPYYPDNVFVVGYKGDSYLDAGYVYAPYLPIYATPTTILDDFIYRKGLATSYGKIMLNANLYAKGTITNTPS